MQTPPRVITFINQIVRQRAPLIEDDYSAQLQATPESFSPTSLNSRLGFSFILSALFFMVKYHAEYIKTELGNLKAQLPELLFSFMSQNMAS